MLTIEQIRHANLHLLTARGHKQSALGRSLGIDRRQVNQWFVMPPLRDLSSDYARRLEKAFDLEVGSMDHPNLGESQSARLDLEMLADAIAVAMADPDTFSPQKIADAYALLLERAAPPKVRELPLPNHQGPSGNVAIEGRDIGTVEDPRRKSRQRKA